MILSFKDYSLNERLKHLKNVYHVLDIDKLNYVLKNNKISSYKFTGISTTRSRFMSGYTGDSPVSWFKLELDYVKLNKDYKNKKFVFRSVTNVSMPEEEEQLFETSEISPAFDYITKVILIKSRIERSMTSIRDNGPSDWITDAPVPKRKVPEIIKHFYQKLKERNMKFFVQEFDGRIVEDDAYIQKLMDIKLKHVDIYYAYAYRKNKRVNQYTQDVIYDPVKKVDHVLIVGKEYPQKDFVTLANSVEELKTKYKDLQKEFSVKLDLSKEDAKYYTDMAKKHGDDVDFYWPTEKSVLNQLMFRDIGNGEFYLEDSKPWDW